MEDLDRILDQFTDPLAGSLHGAVFIAIDKLGTFFCIFSCHSGFPYTTTWLCADSITGNVIYKRAAGKADFETPSAKPLGIDSLYWIASMTKMVTAVAVMQLVERGIISLDDDVREKVPELRDIQILEDMKHGMLSQSRIYVCTLIVSLGSLDSSLESVQPKLVPVRGKIAIR
jgi:hypothetical protein